MSPSTPVELLTREEHPEAIVIRIGIPRLLDGEEVVAIKDALNREVEVGDRPLILDLVAVEFLSSAVLGWLLFLRKKLRERGKAFQPPCRRRALFAFFPDQQAALEAIRQGESDPLLFCGARPEVMEVFFVCGQGADAMSA